MSIVNVGAERMSYDSATDVLYASSGDYDPATLDEEVDAGNGVYLQYSWPGHEPAFLEIFGFSKRYGSLPTDIRLELPESMTIALPKELAIA